MILLRRIAVIATGVLILLTAHVSHALQLTRGPYLQLGTPTSVVVRWRTDEATASGVRYGSAPGNLTLVAGDAPLTMEHEVSLTGLLPDTKYYYSIGTSSQALAGGDFQHFFITSPVPGTARPARIWVLGDSGTKDANARAVRDAYYGFTGSRHTDLWLMLGDNAYTNGEDAEYQLAVFDIYPQTLRKSVLWPTRGNHDLGPMDTLGNWTNGGTYYNVFSLPRAGEAGGMASGTEVYYSFDYGNVHFICLESTLSQWRAIDSPMWTWLEEDLAANDKHWTIAFWHHPPYSKGSHDSDTVLALREMRERALPILEDGGVDLVLSGHSHSYERSFLLDQHYGRSSTLTDAMKLDAGNGRVDGDGAYTKPTLGASPHDGAVYVVAGSSGKTTAGSLNHPVMVVSFNLLGSVVLEVDGNQLDAKFIDVNRAVFDSFTMLKGPVGTGPALQLTMIFGNDQVDRVGATLPLPFVVEVRDGNNLPVAGVPVTFEIATGEGSLVNTQPQITGVNGRAATTLTLGMTPGITTVRATAAGLTGTPVIFNATGVVPPQATLTVNVVGSGTVTLDPPGGVYDQGTDVTLTAEPAAGGSFSGWSGDLSGTANPATITMSADRSNTATFTEPSGGGSVVHEETQTGASSALSTVSTSAALAALSGHLYLAAITTRSPVAVSAVSGLGLSWSRVDAQCTGRNMLGLELWKAQGTPTGSGVVTAALAGVAKNALIAVSRYAGVAAVNAVGNIVSGNTGGVDGACSGGVDSAAYSFNLSTTVPGATVYGVATMRNRTHTPGSGYTERLERTQGSGGDVASVAVEERLVASPASVVVNGALSGTTDWSVIGLEIKPGSVVHEETATGGSGSSNTVATSAALTGVPGNLYLAAISSRPQRTVTGVSGLGLTWTQVATQCGATSTTTSTTMRVSVWKAQGTPTGNGPVTATLSSAPTNAIITASRYSGVAAANPIGNVISGNTAGVNGACSGGVDSNAYSFNLTTTVNNAVVYGAVARRDKTHTEGAGYMERSDVQIGSGSSIAAGIASDDRAVATASTVAVNGTLSGTTAWAVIGIEIKPQ